MVSLEMKSVASRESLSRAVPALLSIAFNESFTTNGATKLRSAKVCE
jgi:hypothetical protein